MAVLLGGDFMHNIKAVFLDVDGVLNWIGSKSMCVADGIPYLGIDSNKVKRLSKIIKTTDAKIVLTSDWGRQFNIGAYKQETKHSQYLSNKLRKEGLRVYDKIDWNNFQRRQRGAAIMDWVERHPNLESWVVLDDEWFWVYDKEPIRERFIHCFNQCGSPTKDHEKYCGLTESLADHAINILLGQESGTFQDEEGTKFLKTNPWKINDYSNLLGI